MKSVIPFLALLAIAGCAAPTPTIDTSAEAEMSFDGLYPLKGTIADQAWSRPDVDLSQFSKIMLESVGVEYRPGGESRRHWSARTSADHYEVTEKQKEAFTSILREVFLEELASSKHFEIVTEPGPDVLLIRGGLLDVVSFVPPEPISAMSSIYISRVGEATLVIELRDSITEAILARAIDRRAAEPMTRMQESSRVTNTAEVKRLARTWARILRERLDEFAAPAE